MQNILSDGFNPILRMGLTDVLDILIVAFLVYKLIGLVRRTSTYKVARGLLVLIFLLILSNANFLGLSVINFLLRKTFELGLLALVILFQPELRRGLEKVGSGKLSAFFGGDIKLLNTDMVITQTVLACSEMARTRTGALIVFERDNHLNEIIGTGTVINADVTAELLKNIFFDKAPLHDGAVIVKDGKMAAAGCMLPLSKNSNLSRDLGMRHRAGIGMSEQSDAVVVMVSEETGSISVAVDGMLKRHLAIDTLEKLLKNELVVDESEEMAALGGPIANLFKGKKNGK